MKKLTADTCRSFIKKINRNRINHGISLDAEVYLQALEIALTVLEKQESTPQIDNDGWIEWSGGECPIKPGDICDIKCRDGEFFRRLEDYQLDWGYDGTPADIIAYRVIENDGREG